MLGDGMGTRRRFYRAAAGAREPAERLAADAAAQPHGIHRAARDCDLLSRLYAKVARHYERPRVTGRRKTLLSVRDRTVAFTAGANGDTQQRFVVLLGK